MQAITNRRYGSPDVLRLEEVPTPTPGPGQVLVRVTATVVTPPDMAARSGSTWAERLAFGLLRPRATVLGSICAGVVEAIGDGVTRWAEGDRVVGGSRRFGAHAEFVVLPADGAVVAIPSAVTAEDAVSIAEAGLTALPFLRDHARLRAGQSLLVNGASGSVGSAAVQLGKVLGAEVTGVCSSANLELVDALGADRVIDYTREDFTAATDAYDVVFDAVGASSFRRCRQALKPGGVYLTTVPSLAILAQTLVTRAARRRAAIAFTGLRPAREQAADLVQLLDLAAVGHLRAVIDRRYPLAAVPDAHRYVETGRKKGSVIVTPETAPS